MLTVLTEVEFSPVLSVRLFFHTLSQEPMHLGSPNLTRECSTTSRENPCFGVKRSRSWGTKKCWRRFLHSCECWHLIFNCKHPQQQKNSCIRWKFNVPFQHKYGYITDERSGVESYPYPVKKASDILTPTLTAFLFSSHPKRERDQQAHLNYYASAYNRKRQLSHRKTELNQIRQKQACILI